MAPNPIFPHFGVIFPVFRLCFSYFTGEAETHIFPIARNGVCTRQNGLFADFYFWSPDFSRILSPDFFSSFFLWEKEPRKILQENLRQNPPKLAQQKSPTHFCTGAGPRFMIFSLLDYESESKIEKLRCFGSLHEE